MATSPKVLEALNNRSKNTMMEVLDIRFTGAGNGYVSATMPVDHRTHQPMGLLHGGATIALAETVGSSGSAMLVDTSRYAVVGINMQASHITSIRSGMVTAHGKLLHKGRSTHIWDIVILGPEGQTISVCRLTNFIKKLE